MVLTTTKTIKFDDLMKVMKKFVATKNHRPALQLVSFDGQYFTATDSFRLIRVNADYVSDIPGDLQLFDPKNHVIVNEKINYPDTSRLIPNNSNSTLIINDVIKEFHNHVKETKKVVKKNNNKIMKLEFKRNETILTGNNHETEKEENKEYSAKINTHLEGEEITLHINPNYLEIALDSVKKLSKHSKKEIELNLISNMRPVVIKQDNVFEILLLPIRK